MCLITKQKKVKILKKELIVYKILIKYPDEIVSWHYVNFWWELNKLYKQKLENTSYLNAYDELVTNYYRDEEGEFSLRLIAIGEGFHSALKNKRLKLKKRLSGNGIEYVYECIIPAGSEYYKDATGLIVSNQIIIKKQL